MKLYATYMTCRHCSRPHERDGDDFTPDLYCRVCSEERRAVATAAFGGATITSEQFLASGDYILPRHLA